MVTLYVMVPAPQDAEQADQLPWQLTGIEVSWTGNVHPTDPPEVAAVTFTLYETSRSRDVTTSLEFSILQFVEIVLGVIESIANVMVSVVDTKFETKYFERSVCFVSVPFNPIEAMVVCFNEGGHSLGIVQSSLLTRPWSEHAMPLFLACVVTLKVFVRVPLPQFAAAEQGVNSDQEPTQLTGIEVSLTWIMPSTDPPEVAAVTFTEYDTARSRAVTVSTEFTILQSASETEIEAIVYCTGSVETKYFERSVCFDSVPFKLIASMEAEFLVGGHSLSMQSSLITCPEAAEHSIPPLLAGLVTLKVFVRAPLPQDAEQGVGNDHEPSQFTGHNGVLHSRVRFCTAHGLPPFTAG